MIGARMMNILGVLGFGAAVFILSYHYNKRFLDWLRFQSLGTRDYIVEKLALMYIDIPPHRILIGLFVASFGLGALIVLLCLPNLMAGFTLGAIATVIGWKAPKPVVDLLYKRRVEKLVTQMIDALSLMSNGLKSGLSIVQALALVTQEMPNPINQEFNLVLNENKLGVPLEDAFNNLAKRVASDDVEMFVTSINILKETGGNLAETFDTIVTTIRERIKVEKKISAMTFMGFVQGMVVMSVPLGLGLVLYASDPAFMRPMFTTPLGMVFILVILGLEVVGFFVIMKIIKIDV
jgi:tight adherence protein B